MEIKRRKLERMPFDKRFDVDGRSENCHATGYEVCWGTPDDPSDWWEEYEGSDGSLQYGR